MDPSLVTKEFREAEADLFAAERSLAEHQEKWAIIQGYYSLFHSLRALVFSKGYREKSHRCLKFAFEELRSSLASSPDGLSACRSPACG